MKAILIAILKRVGSAILMDVLQKAIEELEKRQDNTVGKEDVQVVKAMQRHLNNGQNPKLPS